MISKATYQAVSDAIAKGAREYAACQLHGVGVAAWRRWCGRVAETGEVDMGLQELPRTGRPRKVEVTAGEADYLARLYLRSNWRESKGSMSMCARIAAKDKDSPLRPEVREAILGGAWRHALPTAVKEAMRLGNRAVARYRDPKDGLNNGHYTPGWLRMADSTAGTPCATRRLLPGERQVWDDASVNIAVVVPWERGGDTCSDRYGVRLVRFQLLLGVDCATDFCPGFGYVMRANDAYDNFDVRSTLLRVWEMSGYAPDQCVMEGGAWQARNTLDFLNAAGVSVISAKGRPNQKLVEGYFNRLWTALSIIMPKGQVGRYRGEMVAETKHWTACQKGERDPRGLFPRVDDLMNGLRMAITLLNEKRRVSPLYGKWVPEEEYFRLCGASRMGHELPEGLRAFVMPVRKETTLRRAGMALVTAETPYAFDYQYAFAWPDGWKYEGARVSVAFDPADIQAGAEITLAKRWQELPAGAVVGSGVPCVSPAPMLWQRADGIWQAATLDARGVSKGVKRSGRALIGAQVAAFDERGSSSKVRECGSSKVGTTDNGQQDNGNGGDFELYAPQNGGEVEAEFRYA